MRVTKPVQTQRMSAAGTSWGQEQELMLVQQITWAETKHLEW